jgi:type I restriction enzyme, S subunit
MGNEWKKTSFENAPLEIIDGDRGTNYPKQEGFTASGHCLFLNAKNVTNDGFNFSDRVFITMERDLLLRKGKLQRFDVILTTRGTVGNVAYFDESIPFEHIRINSGMVIFRSHQKYLLPRFLYLFLRSANFKSQIASLQTGSAQPQLPIRDIKKIEMRLPSLDSQRAIAHILGSLDDKIELNRQMNRTLENMAQAIFKSWFIDFDPVHAKVEGRDTGLPEEIADLFPDSFEDSELREIPKGWRVKLLSSVIKLIGGGTPKTGVGEYWDGDIPWFSVVDAPNESDLWVINTQKYVSQAGIANSSTKVLPIKTTIISARGTVGKCALVGYPMAMNQSCYGIRPVDGYGEYYTNYMVRNRIMDLQRSAHGSVFNTITGSTFDSIRIADGGGKISEAFDRIVDSYLLRIFENLREILALSKLRDTLLPKLISGELPIPDAEKILEGIDT